MITVRSFYFQGIQAVDRKIIHRETVKIRGCAVQDICQGIFCDRVYFFAVIYFYVTVTSSLITHTDGDFFLNSLSLCFLGIILCVRRIFLCIAVCWAFIFGICIGFICSFWCIFRIIFYGFFFRIFRCDHCIRIIKSIFGIICAVIIHKAVICQWTDCWCHRSGLIGICFFGCLSVWHIPEEIIRILGQFIAIFFINFNLCDRWGSYRWECSALCKVIQSSHERPYCGTVYQIYLLIVIAFPDIILAGRFVFHTYLKYGISIVCRKCNLILRRIQIIFT